MEDPASVSMPMPAPVRANRGLAVVAALATFWFSASIGCVMARRPRRAAFWLLTDWAFYALMVAAVITNHPRLMWTGLVGFFAWRLPAAIDSYRVARRAPELATWSTLVKAWVGLSLGALVVPMALVRPFLVEAFKLPSGSMFPTMRIGDHVLVDKTATKPARGDVVVFKYPLDPSTDYIKRVVGLAGDTVEIVDGVLTINGQPVQRERLDDGCPEGTGAPSPDEVPKPCVTWRETLDRHTYETVIEAGDRRRDMPSTAVPPWQLFVLGDNRDNSSDSRVWGFVPLEYVKGTARFIWWSSDAAGATRWDRVDQLIR